MPINDKFCWLDEEDLLTPPVDGDHHHNWNARWVLHQYIVVVALK
jgi:hypothetical protein